jgi:hypothetical protein
VGGILGMIAALPILAMLKHTFTFYDFRLSRATWAGDDGAVLVTASSTGPPVEPVTAEGAARAPEGERPAKSRRTARRSRIRSRRTNGEVD